MILCLLQTETCAHCEGRGLVPDTDYVEHAPVPSGRPCDACNGKGRVPTMDSWLSLLAVVATHPHAHRLDARWALHPSDWEGRETLVVKEMTPNAEPPWSLIGAADEVYVLGDHRGNPVLGACDVHPKGLLFPVASGAWQHFHGQVPKPVGRLSHYEEHPSALWPRTFEHLETWMEFIS